MTKLLKFTTLMVVSINTLMKAFGNQSYILINFQCETTEKFRLLGYAIQYDRIMSKLYADLLASIVSIFNHHPTPICNVVEVVGPRPRGLGVERREERSGSERRRMKHDM